MTKRYIRRHLMFLLIADVISIFINSITPIVSYLKNIIIEFIVQFKPIDSSLKSIKPSNIHSITGQQIALTPVSGQKFNLNIPLHCGSFLSYIFIINLA